MGGGKWAFSICGRSVVAHNIRGIQISYFQRGTYIVRRL